MKPNERQRHINTKIQGKLSYESKKHKVLLMGVQRVRITQFGGFQEYLADKKGIKYFKGQEEVHHWVRNSEYLRKGNHIHKVTK